MRKYKVILALNLLLLTGLVQAEMIGWKQLELNQKYMSSLTKDQCVEKTIASLKVDAPSEDYIKTLAGISGDCVTWAKGTEKQFCKTYAKKFVRGICSVNALDARDCILIHTVHQSFCYTKKYK